MSYNYTLKYRTYNQLLDDVLYDFTNYSLEGMIDPQQFIKVAKRVNYDLGLRIYKTKETLLDVEKGRIRLPDDFFVLNYAMICDSVTINQGFPQGTHIAEIPYVAPYQLAPPPVNICAPAVICTKCQPSPCSCSAPTCVTPCAVPATCDTCGPAPCSCNILLKLPDPCSKTSTIVNTTDTNTSIIYTCCWTNVLLLQGYQLSILVNGLPYVISLGTVAAMEAALNLLGLGTWTVTSVSTNRFNFCVVGTNIYGAASTIVNNTPVFVTNQTCGSATTILVTNTSVETCVCDPGCESTSDTSSTTATSVVQQKNCCWTYRLLDGVTSITLLINGISYSLPLTGIPNTLTYLNGLGLGIWTLTATITNVYTLCVDGLQTYGILTVVRPQAALSTQPACYIDSTTTTVTTTIITCKCNPVAQPPVPCPPAPTSCAVNSCAKPSLTLNCKGECFELVQVINPGITRTWKRLLPLRILENPQSVECGCPNLYINSGATAWIRDGWLYTDFPCGTVYISYQGQLEDDDGNLLVPDHDMLNEYYEYALKQRILENLVMNGENVGPRMQLVEARLRAARNNALSIVNTPNFSEMKRVFDMNRKAQYARYYDMFKSYGPNVYDRSSNNYMGNNPTGY